MSATAIQVHNLGKQYQLGMREERYATFREAIVRAVKAPFQRFRRLAGRAGAAESFWALKDASFDIHEGEVVGIIGRNGAGKSTLLKILSQITEPTTGEACLHGRVGSLLEVGTGFHPELTGRENIYLNGSILGMKGREINKNFDEIVAFADVEKFLDTPVKRYSSGMYIRLAFAVAAHLNPEILIVDEVLAVGDMDFQQKCLGKMGDVAKSGRTVLFVSHNMAAIKALCTCAVLMSHGTIVAKGPTSQIIDRYMSDVRNQGPTSLRDRVDRQGSGALHFTSVTVANRQGKPQTSFQCGEDATLLLDFENTEERDFRTVRLALGIDDELGQRVLLLDTALLGKDMENVRPGAGRITVSIPRLALLPGRYTYTICSRVNGIIADWIRGAGVFDVEGGDYFGTGQLPGAGQGIFVTEHNMRYEPAPSLVPCSTVS